jgi:hypothetical protein
MWHVDPLLGDDRERSNDTTAVNKHVSTNETIARKKFDATIMGSGVFYAVRADML